MKKSNQMGTKEAQRGVDQNNGFERNVGGVSEGTLRRSFSVRGKLREKSEPPGLQTKSQKGRGNRNEKRRKRKDTFFVSTCGSAPLPKRREEKRNVNQKGGLQGAIREVAIGKNWSLRAKARSGGANDMVQELECRNLRVNLWEAEVSGRKEGKI